MKFYENIYAYLDFEILWEEFEKISKVMNISSCSIYYKLKELGIMIRKKRKLKISKNELKKLYIDKGLSCSQIAEKLKFDKNIIFNINILIKLLKFTLSI